VIDFETRPLAIGDAPRQSMRHIGAPTHRHLYTAPLTLGSRHSASADLPTPSHAPSDHARFRLIYEERRNFGWR
jgi:hypothetical protein